jgi:hypothetical protein
LPTEVCWERVFLFPGPFFLKSAEFSSGRYQNHRYLPCLQLIICKIDNFFFQLLYSKFVRWFLAVFGVQRYSDWELKSDWIDECCGSRMIKSGSRSYFLGGSGSGSILESWNPGN